MAHIGMLREIENEGRILLGGDLVQSFTKLVNACARIEEAVDELNRDIDEALAENNYDAGPRLRMRNDDLRADILWQSKRLLTHELPRAINLQHRVVQALNREDR